MPSTRAAHDTCRKYTLPTKKGHGSPCPFFLFRRGRSGGPPPAILFMDFADVLDLLFDRGCKPVLALLGCAKASGAVGPGLGVILPGWVGDQGATLDPIHIIRWGRDEV